MYKALGFGELMSLRCTLDLQKGKNGYLFLYSESQEDGILSGHFSATPVKNPKCLLTWDLLSHSSSLQWEFNTHSIKPNGSNAIAPVVSSKP